MKKLLDQEVERLTALVEQNAGKRRVNNNLRPALSKSIRSIVTDGLCAAMAHGEQAASVHLSDKWYRKSNPLNKHDFSYRIFVQRAFMSLVDLNVVQIVRRGYYDALTSTGELTKFALTGTYLDHVNQVFSENGYGLEDILVSDVLYSPDPLIRVSLKNNKGVRKWVLPDEGVRPLVRELEARLEKINRTLKNSWIDLELNEEEWAKLGRIEGLSVSFSRRFLYRVFNDPKLTTNGRFVGPWWQTIPSELRGRITVNGKRTVEIDFSGMHPRILYALEGVTLDFDPYSIPGLTGRSEVKKAFNAMINSSSNLRRPPRGLTLKSVGGTWEQVKQAILNRHKAIGHRFFTGFGLRLMALESQLAEDILLKLSEHGVVCLPVHDSFLVHHGYESFLHKCMQESFVERFGVDPGLSANHGSVPESEQIPDEASSGEVMESLLKHLSLPNQKRLMAYHNRFKRC